MLYSCLRFQIISCIQVCLINTPCYYPLPNPHPNPASQEPPNTGSYKLYILNLQFWLKITSDYNFSAQWTSLNIILNKLLVLWTSGHLSLLSLRGRIFPGLFNKMSKIYFDPWMMWLKTICQIGCTANSCLTTRE